MPGIAAAPRRHSATVALCATLACLSVDASAAEFTGPLVHIVDGDTFDMRASERTIRMRFCGIDSPENGQAGSQPPAHGRGPLSIRHGPRKLWSVSPPHVVRALAARA
jgi:endonuclease YncB( thermonuclease family)